MKKYDAFLHKIPQESPDYLASSKRSLEEWYALAQKYEWIKDEN